MIFPQKMFIQVRGYSIQIYVQGEWEKNFAPSHIYFLRTHCPAVFRNPLPSQLATNDRSDIKNIPPVFKS